jgi:hypothetical protein
VSTTCKLNVVPGADDVAHETDLYCRRSHASYHDGRLSQKARGMHRFPDGDNGNLTGGGFCVTKD